MLGKLLKYEIPAMGRKLLPLYAAWAVTALLLGLSAQIAATRSEFMVVISALLYTAIATAILVMTVILIIQRYRNSLLGDEAYFNQTLPVTVSAHIGNKLISATLWIFITIIAAVLTGLLIALGAIIAGGVSGLDLRELMQGIHFNLPKRFWLYAIEMFILVVAGSVKTIMQIYAAVTIGHQVQEHTTLASIGAYIGILMFEGFIGRAVVAVIPSFHNLWINDESDVIVISQVFMPSFVSAALFSAIYFFVCKYLMEKRLNIA